MFFQRIKTPGIAHNAYLIGSNGIGVLIDPRRDVDEYFEVARTNKLAIRYVLETHRQEDFVLGSSAIRRRCGAKIVSGKHKYFAHSDLRLADGEDLEVGQLLFRCLYTPGHTPESVSYAVYFQDKPDSAWAVFTGDALFVGEAGRTDLPDVDKTAENAAILFDSIHNKIKPLGDQTLLYPAHGAGSVCGGNIADYDESTLGFERNYNPAFTQTREEFIQLKLKERIPRPPYFRLMEKLNLKGGLALSQYADMIPSLLPRDFKRESTKGIVIDTRLPAAFGGGHIPGSYSIWLDGLPVFGGWIADDKVPVYLVLDRPDDLEEACIHLQRIGVDNIRGVLAGGFEGWRDAGLEISMSGTLSVTSDALQRKGTTILDVREISEFEEGHIRGSRHAYVGFIPELGTVGRQLDRKQPLAVTCSVGHRASLAVSMLLRMGFRNVFNLLGGMTAWTQLDKPVVTGSDKIHALDRKILARGISKEPAAKAVRAGT
ncbi:MAG: MBL fold metallo-hydrolase [Nitrospira sp.]